MRIVLFFFSCKLIGYAKSHSKYPHLISSGVLKHVFIFFRFSLKLQFHGDLQLAIYCDILKIYRLVIFSNRISLALRFTLRLPKTDEDPPGMLFSGKNLSLSSVEKSLFTSVNFKPAFHVKLGVLYE